MGAVAISVEGAGARIDSGARGYRAVVLSDVHLPYGDPVALALARHVVEEANPDLAVINGDLWDAYEVAPWPVRPRRRTEFAAVRDRVREQVSELLSWLPSQIVYLEGNHEQRISRYLWRRAGELAELEELSIPSLLGLPESVTYLPHPEEYAPLEQPNQPEVWLGKLLVCHGDALRLSANVQHVAMTALRRLGSPVMLGHYHVQQHIETVGYDGRAVGAWAVGCLCLPRPHYAASRIGAHGMAVVDVAPDGTFHVELITILTRERQVQWRGQLWRV